MAIVMKVDGQAEPRALQRVEGVLERLLSEGTAEAASDGSIHEVFPVAIDPRQGRALRDRVVTEKAARTLEIGLGYGVSALFIWAGLLENGQPNPHHVVMDPFQRPRFADLGLQMLDEAGVLPGVEFYAEASRLVLPRLVAEGREFDLAFVDGNHRFDWVFVDLFYLGSLARPGGIIFLDDYQLPGIAKAAAFFVTNRGWVLEEVSDADPNHHWAVLRTPEQVHDRPYDFFIDF